MSQSMTQRNTLRNATLYQWLFYLRWRSRDNPSQREQHSKNFSRVLQDALEWAGENSALSAELSPGAPHAVSYSERIASVGWQEHNGVLRELESRTLLDAFYLQLGQAIEGDAEPATFANLTLWSPPEQPDNFLGGALCLCAEVDETLSATELQDLCAEIAACCPCTTMEPDAAVKGIPLPIGYLAIVPNETRETFVLLYYSTARETVGRFLHLLLPPLILSLTKRRSVAQQYEHLIAQLHEQEQALDSLLKKTAEPRLNLEQLETLSADISRQQMGFIEGISTLEELLHTLRINRRNLELLFEDALWGERRAEAGALLTSEFNLLVEQVEADLRYLQITREQADKALQSLLTVASIRSTQWERRIVSIATLLALISLVGLVQDVVPWQARVGAVGVAFFVLILLWLRRK